MQIHWQNGPVTHTHTHTQWYRQIMYCNVVCVGQDVIEVVLHAGMTTDSESNLYIADSSHGRVCIIYNSNGTLVCPTAWASYWDPQSGDWWLTRPQQVAVDSAFNIYVLSDMRICKINSSWVISCPLAWRGGQVPGGIQMPRGIAVDSESNIYVSDWMFQVVCVISGQNGSVYCPPPSYAPGLQGPSYLAVDANRNVYIISQWSRSVCMLSSANDHVSCPAAWVLTCGPIGCGQPGGLAVDTAANVYVLDTGRSIHSQEVGCLYSRLGHCQSKDK